MTRQRRLIYEIINERAVHLTAEEIYEKAKARMPDIARGTVYRNLGLMVEAGEIRRIDLSGGAACYDRTVAPHVHLICKRCRTVTDRFIDDLAALVGEMTGEEIEDCDLIAYTICQNCR